MPELQSQTNPSSNFGSRLHGASVSLRVPAALHATCISYKGVSVLPQHRLRFVHEAATSVLGWRFHESRALNTDEHIPMTPSIYVPVKTYI